MQAGSLSIEGFPQSSLTHLLDCSVSDHHDASGILKMHFSAYSAKIPLESAP